MANKKTLGIILVLYKQKQNLELLYRSLAGQSFKDFKIYFVDNNPGKEDYNFSEELNRTYRLDIEYLRPESNAGFARGNNIGALIAMDDGCKYIFFLNNDAELEKECLKELIASVNSARDIGIAAPIIFYGTSENPKTTIQEYGAIANFKNYKINKIAEGKKFYSEKDSLADNMEVDLVSGGATFAKAETLLKAGMWEISYFAYGDEIDLASRVKDAGYKTVVTKKAMLWHNHKWEKSNKEGYYFEYYLIQRNKYLYFRKHGLLLQLFTALLVDSVKFPWRLIWFIRVCDFSLGIYYLRGTFAGLFGKGGIPSLKFLYQ